MGGTNLKAGMAFESSMLQGGAHRTVSGVSRQDRHICRLPRLPAGITHPRGVDGLCLLVPLCHLLLHYLLVTLHLRKGQAQGSHQGSWGH